MKRTLRTIALSALLALCLPCALIFAERTDSSGTWKITIQGDGVIINGLAKKSPEPRVDLVIPQEIDGIAVTAIGANAFKNCTEIVSIQLPETLRMVGENAFRGCSSLERVNIPSSVLWIGSWAFRNDSGSLKEVHVPRLTHIHGVTTFPERTLVYVFKESQAAEKYTGTRYDFIYEAKDAPGGTEEAMPEEYLFWENHAFATVFTNGSTESMRRGPEVTEEDLSQLVTYCLIREGQIIKTPATNNPVIDESNGYSYVRNGTLVNLSDSGYKIPHHYMRVTSYEESVPNFIYIVYGNPTEENRKHFAELKEELEMTHADDAAYRFEDLEWSYNKILGFDITYRTSVFIDGKEYEVLCTDVDGN